MTEPVTPEFDAAVAEWRAARTARDDLRDLLETAERRYRHAESALERLDDARRGVTPEDVRRALAEHFADLARRCQY